MQDLYAIYHGKLYPASFARDAIILRSTTYQDLQEGFELSKPFIYTPTNEYIVCLKYIKREEADRIFYRRVEANYKGYVFLVTEVRLNMIKIETYKSFNEEVGNLLQMERVDKFVFEKWIRSDEAEINIVEVDA